MKNYCFSLHNSTFVCQKIYLLIKQYLYFDRYETPLKIVIKLMSLFMFFQGLEREHRHIENSFKLFMC